MHHVWICRCRKPFDALNVLAKTKHMQTYSLQQWCTTFFDRGPLIEFLISSGAKQV